MRGSCPSLLESIRKSQDASARSGAESYRPAVDELQDDFFRGFTHGKLYEIAQNQPQTFPQQPMLFFPNVPANPFANACFQPPLPPPNVTGPRYLRPHSYEPGSFKKIPRPDSPKLDDLKQSVHKKKKNRSSSHQTQSSNHQPKVVHSKAQSSKQPRPKSPNYDRLLSHPPDAFPPLSDSRAPREPKGSAPIPSGFLDKIKQQAHEQHQDKQPDKDQDKHPPQ